MRILMMTLADEDAQDAQDAEDDDAQDAGIPG